MFREAPEPEHNRLFCQVELGSPGLVPGGRRSRTETLGLGQAREGQHVCVGTHHQAGERRRGPRQLHRGAFDGLRTEGHRSVEDESAGVHFSTAGGLQKEGLRRDERLLVHNLYTGRPEEKRAPSATTARLLMNAVWLL